MIEFPEPVTMPPPECNDSSVHRQVGIFELSLALLFRPTDSYCIHLDRKAPDMIKEAVTGIVESYQAAFPEANIFLTKVNTVYLNIFNS